MKYYSEKVRKMFDSEKELNTAEKEYDEAHKAEIAKREERKARAVEVEEAYKKYVDLKAKFIEDFGSYHQTLTSKDLPALNKLSVFDLFDHFWF